MRTGGGRIREARRINVMADDEEFEGDTDYPWEHVDSSRKNERLQRKHLVTPAKEHYLDRAKACPKCGVKADRLEWFYFDSPKETWKMLCGCAGWIKVCDPCHVQVDFLEVVIS